MSLFASTAISRLSNYLDVYSDLHVFVPGTTKFLDRYVARFVHCMFPVSIFT